MKRRLATLLLVLFAACGGRQLTNRQVATYAIGGVLVAAVVTAMVLSASCNNCDNN